MQFADSINEQGLLIPGWPAPDTVKAICTTRISFQKEAICAAALSGRSTLSDYAAFNLALHVNDVAGSVLKNRQQLAAHLQLKDTDIGWLEQVHGTSLVSAELACARAHDDPTQADASITGKSGFAACVMTADCLPVLFCNLPEQHETQMVAAAHAGWRGLAAGILSKTLADFPQPERVIAWLGPAISQKHFEVGNEVFCAFVEKNSLNKTAFIPANKAAEQTVPTPEAKWLACLYTLAKIELGNAGIKAVYGGQHCTYEQASLFYSYRRDGATSGRMASLIFTR